MKINKSLIEDLIILEKSGMYGLGLAAEEYSESKVRYLRISDINDDGNIINSDKKSITAENIQNYLLEQDDLVVARTGNSTGRVYVYDQSDGILAYAGFLIKFVFDKNKINPRYMKYYCQSNYYKYQIKGFNGSTRGNMNANDFKTVQVFYPEREKQDKIVLLFDLLNNKIQVNNKINSELEAMAKTIYDYWFLQFEFPNEEGKPYKSSGGKMVWNEELKREIPEGWEIKSIFDELSVQYGFPFATDKFTDVKTDIPVVRIRDILTNTISTYSNENVDEKYRLNEQDLLIGMDGNFHMNYWIDNTSYLNQRSVRLRTKDTSNVSIIQVKYNIAPYIKAKEERAGGSTVGHLSDKDLKELKILVPKTKKLREILDNTLMKIVKNRKENQELTSLRDFLLPLLMNGQVGFKEEN